MSKLVCIPLPPGWRDVSGGLPYELARFVPEPNQAGGVLEIALRPDLQGTKRPRGTADLRKLAFALAKSHGTQDWKGESIDHTTVGRSLEISFELPKRAVLEVWYYLPSKDKGLPVIQVTYITRRSADGYPCFDQRLAARKIADGLYLAAPPRRAKTDADPLPWYRVVAPRVKRRRRREQILGKTRPQILRGFKESRGYWEGERRLRCWGETVAVWINRAYDDDEEPTDRQLELLETILHRDGDLRPEFERLVGKWYKEYYEFGPDALQLKRPGDIWKLVEKGETTLVIRADPPRKAVEFYLYPGCDFEPTEGVAVRYRNWKAVWVGYQSAAD
jgi:hypothetical protein